MIFGHLHQTAAGTFGDQGIAVGQPLRTADKGAVEIMRIKRLQVPCFGRGMLPNNFHGHRIDFRDSGVVTAGSFFTGRELVRHTIACPAAVVIDQDVAFAWQSAGNHVGVMLADDDADAAGFFGFVVVRA